jgi:hypothetical protein
MGHPLLSLTPSTAVTDGLSASVADGRHLASPVAARVLSLANPGSLVGRGRLDKKPPPNEVGGPLHCPARGGSQVSGIPTNVSWLP